MTRKKIERKATRSRLPSSRAIEATKNKQLFVQGQLIAIKPRWLFCFSNTFFIFLCSVPSARYKRGEFLLCEVDMPVFNNHTEMSIIPYRKVGERKFLHHFPGRAISIPVNRFLSQVKMVFWLLSSSMILRFILAPRNFRHLWSGNLMGASSTTSASSL